MGRPRQCSAYLQQHLCAPSTEILAAAFTPSPVPTRRTLGRGRRARVRPFDILNTARRNSGLRLSSLQRLSSGGGRGSDGGRPRRSRCKPPPVHGSLSGPEDAII